MVMVCWNDTDTRAALYLAMASGADGFMVMVCWNNTDAQTHTWQWGEVQMLCSVLRACGIQTCEVVEWGYGLNYICDAKGTFFY